MENCVYTTLTSDSHYYRMKLLDEATENLVVRQPQDRAAGRQR
jgi:hypothetical protein